MTGALSAEAAAALPVNFGEDMGKYDSNNMVWFDEDTYSIKEWHEVTLKTALLDVVARLSSRVFLGDQVCRNTEWLNITKEYAVNFFFAATELRMYPRPIRRFIYRFIPRCKKLMAQFRESQRIIWPIVLERRYVRKKAVEAGKPMPNFNDALDW